MHLICTKVQCRRGNGTFNFDVPHLSTSLIGSVVMLPSIFQTFVAFLVKTYCLPLFFVFCLCELIVLHTHLWFVSDQMTSFELCECSFLFPSLTSNFPLQTFLMNAFSADEHLKVRE